MLCILNGWDSSPYVTIPACQAVNEWALEKKQATLLLYPFVLILFKFRRIYIRAVFGIQKVLDCIQYMWSLNNWSHMLNTFMIFTIKLKATSGIVAFCHCQPISQQVVVGNPFAMAVRMGWCVLFWKKWNWGVIFGLSHRCLSVCHPTEDPVSREPSGLIWLAVRFPLGSQIKRAAAQPSFPPPLSLPAAARSGYFCRDHKATIRKLHCSLLSRSLPGEKIPSANHYCAKTFHHF